MKNETTDTKIQFQPLQKEDIPLFVRQLQESFSITVQEKFGAADIIPSKKDIQNSIECPQCESYFVCLEGQCVGGVIVKIDPETQQNELELFYILPNNHSHGLGTATWQAIEKRYPLTRKWKTVTPYFEDRNIHFYVNKCGFHIVEFFNSKHRDPNMPHPRDKNGKSNPMLDNYFLFEKVMIKN